MHWEAANLWRLSTPCTRSCTVLYLRCDTWHFLEYQLEFDGLTFHRCIVEKLALLLFTTIFLAFGKCYFRWCFGSLGILCLSQTTEWLFSVIASQSFGFSNLKFSFWFWVPFFLSPIDTHVKLGRAFPITIYVYVVRIRESRRISVTWPSSCWLPCGGQKYIIDW